MTQKKVKFTNCNASAKKLKKEEVGTSKIINKLLKRRAGKLAALLNEESV